MKLELNLNIYVSVLDLLLVSAVSSTGTSLMVAAHSGLDIDCRAVS